MAHEILYSNDPLNVPMATFAIVSITTYNRPVITTTEEVNTLGVMTYEPVVQPATWQIQFVMSGGSMNIWNYDNLIARDASFANIKIDLGYKPD